MQPTSAAILAWFLATSLVGMDLASQQALVADFATKTYRCTATWNDAGLATLVLSHHDVDKKGQDGKPGIGDADILKLSGLASLSELTLIKQPITESGYAVLATLPQLTVFWQEYVPEGTKADFIAPLAACTGLKVLAIKHNFALANQVSPMASLPAYPALEKLVLDMSSATPEAVDFILRCPSIRHLELHRTVCGDADLERIIAGLPHLAELWLKPKAAKIGITHRSLRLLQAASELRILKLHQGNILPLPFADGLEYLVPMTALKELNLGGTGLRCDHPELALLRSARPDLVISGCTEAKP